MEHLLFYKKQAECFEEALPLGNGRIGAMVYGKTGRERISLNEDTLWSGMAGENAVNENAPEIYAEAQKLVFDGKPAEAESLLEQNFNAMWTQIYLPLGAMYIDFPHINAQNYTRTLDLNSALAAVKYSCGGVEYTREYFISEKNNVLAVKISASEKGAVSFSAEVQTELKVLSRSCENNMLVVNGECPSNGCGYPKTCPEPFAYSGGGLKFAQILKVTAEGGSTAVSVDKIEVKNADSALLLFSAATNYSKTAVAADSTINCKAVCMENINGCEDYEELKAMHIAEHRRLYGRAELSLSGKSCGLPTDERIKAFDGSDMGLYELLFNYGRYLLIASSSKGSEAATLQGIWNEKMLPPWSSNYTVNINTEMNYWPAHICNLAECFEPFVRLAEKISRTGRKTAKSFYNAGGFVSHHNTDLWGHSNPVGIKTEGSSVYAFWNLSSGWIACQLFDDYEYTGDAEKLRSVIYPIIKSAAEFYLELMVRNEDGKLILSPSTSPENHYMLNGSRHSVDKTSAMTVSILHELFERGVKCCEILNTDDDFKNTLQKALAEMETLKTGADGRLLEWSCEKTEAEPQHRHLSHLYSLYPGTDISLEKTPELAEACRKSLVARGDRSTGWSLAWKVNLWAKLHDGDHALKVAANQLEFCPPEREMSVVSGGGTYANMLDAHPPFQIDGNFGITAGIANMLMQSDGEKIEILPALPSAWKNGYVKGLMAKGCVEVSIYWENGKAVKVVLCSKAKQSMKIAAAGETQTVDLPENTEVILK